MVKKTEFKWIVKTDAYWRYSLGPLFKTEWHDSELMPQNLVDELLCITPKYKLENSLIKETRNELQCSECGAMGWHFETYEECAPHFCPNCGTQMIFERN